ncbi:MAG: hypothetical protein KatS3mg052_2936 [Candidatus Roseilinea sp.]|nr:MAG: hypothetical protein KatS3mg052_2936 [Candidatus Roseilinea sp.]
MLPNVRILARRDERLCPRRMLLQAIIAITPVITVIARQMVNWLLNLVQQRFDRLCIMNIVFGQENGFNLTALHVYPQMEFAPGTPLRLSMYSDLPLPFTIHFQPAAVDDDIKRRRAGCAS